MLWKYLHHLVGEAKESSTSGNPYSITLPDQFCNLTWKEFIAWRLDDSNQDTSSASSTRHRGYTRQDSRYKSNQNAYQLLVFKKSIKSKVSQYTIIKDEKYFEALQRNLVVTATMHDCEEVLNGDDKCGNNADCRELFYQNQYFIYNIFNMVLQSYMGKTIVRKYAPSLDAQSVWRHFESHMSTSSKGVNERCILHAYVSTTVYDRSWKGTTEQFVLHFHEQFHY